MSQFFHTLSYVALPLLFAVVLHEYAHGWVANHYGDDTAMRHGRMTLNPLVHIDRVGTIIVPLLCLMVGGVLFGWAKPVPVIPERLRQPRRDMVMVAAAGPAMNFVLAVLSGVLLGALLTVDPTVASQWPPRPGMTPRTDMLGMIVTPLAAMAMFSILINTVIFAFNLLPILPLDGGRIVANGLPPGPAANAFARLEPYGFPALLFLLMIDPWVPVINVVVGTVVNYMVSDILSLFVPFPSS